MAETDGRHDAPTKEQERLPAESIGKSITCMDGVVNERHEDGNEHSEVHTAVVPQSSKKTCFFYQTFRGVFPRNHSIFQQPAIQTILIENIDGSNLLSKPRPVIQHGSYQQATMWWLSPACAVAEQRRSQRKAFEDNGSRTVLKITFHL